MFLQWFHVKLLSFFLSLFLFLFLNMTHCTTPTEHSVSNRAADSNLKSLPAKEDKRKNQQNGIQGEQQSNTMVLTFNRGKAESGDQGNRVGFFKRESDKRFQCFLSTVIKRFAKRKRWSFKIQVTQEQTRVEGMTRLWESYTEDMNHNSSNLE